MDWNKFWAPMRQEMKREQKWPNLISALGIFPAVLYARESGNSVWAACGLALAWYCIVYFFYLIYLYNKE